MLSGIQNAASGSTVVITLDTSILFALASIANDSYFSNQADVEKVIVTYKSLVGNQQKDLVFFLSDLTANLTFSSYCRPDFQISKITLFDFDGGHFNVAVADIPTNFPINF